MTIFRGCFRKLSFERVDAVKGFLAKVVKSESKLCFPRRSAFGMWENMTARSSRSNAPPPSEANSLHRFSK